MRASLYPLSEVPRKFARMPLRFMHLPWTEWDGGGCVFHFHEPGGLALPDFAAARRCLSFSSPPCRGTPLPFQTRNSKPCLSATSRRKSAWTADSTNPFGAKIGRAHV